MAKQETPFASLQELGFQSAGQFSFGVWKNYAVTLRLNQGYYWLDFAVRPARQDRALLKALGASLKESLGRRVPVSYVNSAAKHGKALSFQLRYNRKAPFPEQFTAFADACVKAMREQNVAPADTCAACGAASPESLCFVGTYQPVHASCMRADLEKTREKAEENQANGSYLTGLVGALLGMLVGLIPNVAIAVSSDLIISFLFALVPLAAMWGYRKFNGKMDKGSIGIIIVLSLIGVVVMHYFYNTFSIMKEFKTTFGLALAFTADLFRDGDILKQLLLENLQSFLFMALGILFAWRYLNQTNTGSIAGMEAALSTLRPNPNAAQETQDW